MKRFHAFLLVMFIAVFAFVGCQNGDEEIVEEVLPTGITTNVLGNSKVLEKDETFLLEGTIKPSNSTYRDLNYISDNPAIVYVEIRNDGKCLLTAIKKGETNIHITIRGGTSETRDIYKDIFVQVKDTKGDLTFARESKKNELEKLLKETYTQDLYFAKEYNQIKEIINKKKTEIDNLPTKEAVEAYKFTSIIREIEAVKTKEEVMAELLADEKEKKILEIREVKKQYILDIYEEETSKYDIQEYNAISKIFKDAIFTIQNETNVNDVRRFDLNALKEQADKIETKEIKYLKALEEKRQIHIQNVSKLRDKYTKEKDKYTETDYNTIIQKIAEMEVNLGVGAELEAGQYFWADNESEENFAVDYNENVLLIEAIKTIEETNQAIAQLKEANKQKANQTFAYFPQNDYEVADYEAMQQRLEQELKLITEMTKIKEIEGYSVDRFKSDLYAYNIKEIEMSKYREPKLQELTNLTNQYNSNDYSPENWAIIDEEIKGINNLIVSTRNREPLERLDFVKIKEKLDLVEKLVK